MRQSSRPSIRKSQRQPRFESLEARELLAAGLGASWIGQDGHDFAGGQTADAGNAVQDIRIALAGLPSREISSVVLQGHGGGQWVVNLGGYNPFNGKIVRAPGASVADLYVDPYQAETGREFYVKVTYGDGTTDDRFFQGGAADPNLRMPEWRAGAAWVGQENKDIVGNGAGIGPDGVIDARFTLDHLYPPTAISGVTVTRSAGAGWAAGNNPEGLNNAEFVRNPSDPTRGDVYINPDVNLSGQPLTVTILYADGRTDRTTLTGGLTDPNKATPLAPPQNVSWNTLTTRWLGQDGLSLTGPGDVRLGLEGIPVGRSVVSATLSNAFGTAWSYVKPGSGVVSADPYARSLGFRPSSDPTRADLGFAPVRNESGGTLTLQVRLDDGTILATRVVGGASDPELRASKPSNTSVVAFPGDDLNDLTSRFGTVRLVSGVYPMDRPLILSKPVNLIAAPGTTLLFSQKGNDPGWTAAIKVHASHTTLDGFAVRFAGPIRWKQGISYGPAVVGTTDNLDAWTGDPKVDLTFLRMDLQSPPASSSWEEAISLFRLVSAESGRVADNRLKGGMTELKGGPWQVTGNTYLGTLPNTFAYTAFAAHESREVTLSDNRAEPSGPSGKTWRFLVMTQQGIGDSVLNNVVRGIGPMDSDTVAHPNAPEIILTESYRVHYEGMTSRVSADGWLVQIPELQSGLPRTGSVLAILSGPMAGQWRLITQALSSTSYLLDAPIDGGTKVAVSITSGFVNQSFQGNTIDARGSSVADPIVLAGNQFGVKVIGNRTFGGDQSFRITAYPSETPGDWGRTRAPFLGATISGNTFEDSLVGGSLGVESNRYSKVNAGRVYFSGNFLNNTAVWTDAFLAVRASKSGTDPLRLVTIGTSFSVDPGETRLIVSGNRVSGSPSVTNTPTFQVIAGTINGGASRNQGIVLESVTGGGAIPGSVAGGSNSAGLRAQATQTDPVSTSASQTGPPQVASSNPEPGPGPASSGSPFPSLAPPESEVRSTPTPWFVLRGKRVIPMLAKLSAGGRRWLSPRGVTTRPPSMLTRRSW